MHVLKRGLAVAVAFVCSLAAPSVASAEEKSEPAPGPRLHAMIEVASLVLPTAGVLETNRTIGSGADLQLPIGFHFHYRADKLAFGATASLGLFALTTSPYAGTTDLPRTHEKGFFQIAPEGRYYFTEGGSWEFFVGARAGLVMLADRYANAVGDTVPSNYGVKTVSIRTEGLQGLVGLGGNWRMHPLFTLGLDLRGGAFVFPGAQRCFPVGDCGTMQGAYPVFELGVSFGILRGI